MVKFGKYLKRNSIDTYTYINYKQLKQTLNEIYVKLKTSSYKSKDGSQRESIGNIILDKHLLTHTEPRDSDTSLIRDSSNKPDTLIPIDIKDGRGSETNSNQDSIDKIKPFDTYFTNLKRSLLKKFTKLLDGEIEKFYCAFLDKEKEMYKRINHRLHRKKQYDSFSIVDLVREIEEVYKLGILADSTNKYVIINLQCIRKILKKFDKKMKEFFVNSTISVQYIRSKLKIESKDSDIGYIIKFKLIDEIASLIEYLGIELNRRMITLRPEKMYHEKDMRDIDPSDSAQLKAALLNDAADNNCYTFEYKRKFNLFLKGIENTVILLNSITSFRVNPLKSNAPLLKNDFPDMSSLQYITSHKHSSFKNIVHVRDNDYSNVIQLFVSMEAYKGLVRDHMKILSEKNNSNKNVLLFLTFVNSLTYAMVISGLPMFFQAYNGHAPTRDFNPILAALAVIVIHLGMITEGITLNKWLVDKQYLYYALIMNKVSIIVSVVLLMFFTLVIEMRIYYIYPCLFFFGYGIGGGLNTKYFNEYIARLPYDSIIIYEKGLKVIGFCLGIAFMFVFKYTIIPLAILLLLSLFFFTNPKSSSFTQLNKDLSYQAINSDDSKEKIHEQYSTLRTNNYKSNIGINTDNDNNNALDEDEAIELDKNLGKVNEDNKYNDSNIIPDNMKEIIEGIESTHRSLYMYISFHILGNNFINYSSLFLLICYFIEYNFDENKLLLALLFLIPFFGYYLVDFIVFPLMQNLKRARQRSILISMQIALIVWGVFFALSIYEPDLVPQKHFQENSLWKIVFFIVMTTVNCLFEFIEKDFFDSECTIVSTEQCFDNADNAFEAYSTIGKLIGVITPGLMKMLLAPSTALASGPGMSPSSSGVAMEEEQGDYLKSFMFFHLIIYVILLLVFLCLWLMKMAFGHKLVHRLIKEKFYK